MQPLAGDGVASVRLAEIFLQILPSGESVARAGDDDAARAVLHLQHIHHLHHFEDDARIDRVAFGRTVERHPGDPVLDLHEDVLLGQGRESRSGVGHGCLLLK